MDNEKSNAQSLEFAEDIINTVREPLIALDQDLRVVSANRSFYQVFKVKPEGTVGQLIYDLGNKPWDTPTLRELLEKILPQKTTFENYEVEHDFVTIGRRIMLLNARQIEQTWGKKRIILLAIEDITERRRMENLLAESESRYRRLFETASDGIVLKEEKKFIENALDTLKDIFSVFDIDGRPLRWNKTLNTVTGYLDREIALMMAIDFFLEDDRKRVSEAILEGVKKGSVSFEASIVTKEGMQIPYEVSAALLRDTQGEPIGISGVGRDITERKKAEAEIALQQKLRNSLLALHRMTDATEKEIYDFVLDASLVLSGSEFGFIGKMSADELTEIIVSWSKGILKQCGVTQGSGHFPDVDDSLWKEMLRQRSSIIVNDYETSTESKKGYPKGHVPIKRFLGIPVFNAGRIVAVAGGANKETEYTESDESSLSTILHEALSLIERKKIEVALRESEERFRQIAESTKEWIWEVNCDGLYTYSSQVVEDMLGYTPEEVVGKKHFYDFSPADKREQTKKDVLAGIAEKSAFAKYVNSKEHKNGSIVFQETTALPILDIRGSLLGYRGVSVDVSKHRKLEAQLRHSQKMEAVGTLAGGVAHDFNNILNVIMGYGAMVMDTLTDGSTASEDMNEVLIAADRAADLTKRLLVFSRKKFVEVRSVDINELILGLKKLLARIIIESIEFNLDLADKPLIVSADAGEIEQVLINLASNARDAMLKGGQLTIGTGLEEIDEDYVTAYGYGTPGKYALITVADTGSGMDAETQKKIFEPFFTTKGVGEGTGLGLAISYGIIKQHNGYIQVYSEPGEGTLFKLFLPLCDKAVLDKKQEGVAPVKGGYETILLAEDDAALNKLSRIVLESFGYTVITAEDGEDAIAKFLENRERINLVLLDMIMPRKNGKEVCEAICHVNPKMKILFVSGYTMELITNKELEEGDFDFIQKPYPSKSLLSKVREVLDK